MHTCPECGLEHGGNDAVVAEPEPVVVESGPNENDVKIAEIEAEAAVETEKIWSDQQKAALDGELEGMRGELRGMREVLDRIAPEPEAEPEPVIVQAPEAAAPAPEPEAAAPPEEKPEPKTEQKKGFF